MPNVDREVSYYNGEGRRKIVKRKIVDAHMVKGQPLPNLGTEASVKYLGIEFSARGINRDTGVKIEEHSPNRERRTQNASASVIGRTVSPDWDRD